MSYELPLFELFARFRILCGLGSRIPVCALARWWRLPTHPTIEPKRHPPSIHPSMHPITHSCIRPPTHPPSSDFMTHSPTHTSNRTPTRLPNHPRTQPFAQSPQGGATGGPEYRLRVVVEDLLPSGEPGQPGQPGGKTKTVAQVGVSTQHGTHTCNKATSATYARKCAKVLCGISGGEQATAIL